MNWEKGIDIKQVQEVRCSSNVFLGVGAIDKIDDIAGRLKAEGVDSVLVTTGKSAYDKTGAWKVVAEALNRHGIKYVLYNKVRPNPETPPGGRGRGNGPRSRGQGGHRHRRGQRHRHRQERGHFAGASRQDLPDAV